MELKLSRFTPLGEIPEDNQAQRVRVLELGLEIVADTLRVGEKYFALASYIRKEQVSKKIVNQELQRLGFAQPRISEIYRVANADVDTWLAYESKGLAFKRVLALTRDNVKQLSLMLGEGETSSLDAGEIEAGRAHEDESKKPRGKVPAATKAAAAANAIMKLGPKLKDGATWQNGRYTVIFKKTNKEPKTENK